MESLEIIGGNPLYGEVTVSGCKNAAVAIIPAALLAKGVCRIENVPRIRDVDVLLGILTLLGCKVSYADATTIEIDSADVSTYTLVSEPVRRLRGSCYLMGALLGRFGRAKVASPGGCDLGARPIDLHLKGFEALGATCHLEHDYLSADSAGLRGASIYLDIPSVGATINIMLAACMAEGTTVIENPAKEPHVVDVANFLNAMGANVRGAGTDVIKIKGVSTLGGGTYSIIPDQIEAGTFMIAAAAVGGDVLVQNCIPKHMESLSAKLLEAGAQVYELGDSIRVVRKDSLRRTRVKTLPYPGFPTDLQPQMVALLALANGTSEMTESVWDNRFKYVDELKRMGADISVHEKTAIIVGVPSLSGAKVRATDLRAGACLIIAALSAKGKSSIYELVHIDRGYENVEQKFRDLGGIIERVCDDQC